MLNSFFGLEMGRRAMDYFRRGMETAGHNISNADVEGFSRQRVEASTTSPFTDPSLARPNIPGQIGTGVQVNAIIRLRDAFLDIQYRETCAQGVRPLRILGRAGEVIGNTMEVSLDNLYGEGEKYGLFEIELPEGEEGQILHTVSVGLEYEDAATGERVAREIPLRILRTGNEAEVEKNRQMDIVSQAALARNAEIRTEAIRLADEGRAREAAELLESRKDDLRTLAPAAGAAAPLLESEAGEFETLAESLKSEGALSNADRKKVLNDAYIQKSQQTPVASGDVPDKEETTN